MSVILWIQVLYNNDIVILSPLCYSYCISVVDENLKLTYYACICVAHIYGSVTHKIDLPCFSVRAKAAGFFLEMWFRWHQSLWIHCPDFVKVGLHS